MRAPLLAVLICIAVPAAAQESAATNTCSRIDDSLKRLRCFDGVFPKTNPGLLEPRSVKTVPVHGSGQIGDREGLSFKQQVEQCFDRPVVAQRPASVVFAIHLTPDGKLAEEPKVIHHDGDDTSIKHLEFSGRRALSRCAPYALPKGEYEQWKNVSVRFSRDPA